MTTVTWNSPTEGTQPEVYGYASYSFTSSVTVSSPSGSTSFSIVSGTIPAGTTFDSAFGTISGTLTNTSASYTFTIRATNNNVSADRTFTQTVIASGLMWNGPTQGNQGTFLGGSYYSMVPNITTFPPNSQVSWSILYGPLPAGTTINSTTGAVTGTLTNANSTFSYGLVAFGSGGELFPSFSGTIVATNVTTVTWNSPAAGALGTERGGTNYYFVPAVTIAYPVGLTVYSITTGAIPAGTIFDPKTGIISGTLTNTTASYSFTMRASVNGTNADRAFTGNVTAA